MHQQLFACKAEKDRQSVANQASIQKEQERSRAALKCREEELGRVLDDLRQKNGELLTRLSLAGNERFGCCLLYSFVLLDCCYV